MPTIACPGCGAAARPDATSCAYCTRPLASLACGACLGRIFPGMRFCPFCGEAAARDETVPTSLACPACADATRTSVLQSHTVGSVPVAECRTCHGLWLDPATVAELERERSTRAPFAAPPSPVGPAAGDGSTSRAAGVTNPRPPAAPAGTLRGAVRYRRCPVCAVVMNRENVARISGVVVDRCREHGVFFDVDELQQLVQFWDGGGSDRARTRERELLALERRRLEALRTLDRQRDAWGQRPPPEDRGVSFDLLSIAGWVIAR